MGKKPAYTLLEVLVVLAILGILLGLIGLEGPKALQAKTQAQISADLYILASAGHIYAMDHPGKGDPSLDDLYREGYLFKVPDPPVPEGYYRVRILPESGRVQVSLEKGGKVYETKDYRAEVTL